MSWKIRKEMRKYFPDLGFSVRNWGGWYEIEIAHPSDALKDAKRALDIRDEVYKKMADFEAENGISLSITI